MRSRSEDVAMEPESPFQQTVRLLRRRSRLIFACACAGAVLAGFVGLLVPPRYTAKAEVVIQPQVANATAGQETVGVAPEQDESVVQTHLAALMSREHLQRVLDSLSHDKQARAGTASPVAPDSFAVTRQRVTAWLAAWTRASVRPVLALLPWLAGGPHHAAADKKEPQLEAFERHLLVYQERGSHVLGIAFTSTSPQEAAQAANRVAQGYVDTLYEQKRENVSRALAWIGRRIPELRVEVERAEGEVQAFRTDHGLAEGNQTDIVDQKLGELSREFTAAESELSARRARLASIRELRHSGTGIDTLVQTLDSAQLRELRDRELALLQSQAELTGLFGEMHPRTQAVIAQINALRSKVGREVDRAADDLEAGVKIADLQVRSLRDRLSAAQHASSDARGADVRLRDLEHAATTVRQVYESLLQRREQLTERQEMIAPDMRILSLAAPPEQPSSPNPLLFPLPALVAFLIGGGLLAVAGERLDQGLRSARDVSRTLGIPCVGLVPQIRRKGRMRPHQHLLAKPFSAYTEAIRSVIAALQLAVPRGASRVILINSSVPREGKTTLAVSVAVYAALLGRRAILVDLDFRRPAIWRELGGWPAANGPDPGLSVAGIHSIPNLGIDVLPVRQCPDNPLLPFARGELPRLLGQLRLSYDCIVIDSPPLLSVTEARLLATLADKILFVVQWGSTRWDVARNALGLLRDACALVGVDDGIVSAVVTQVDLTKHARYRYGDIGESFVRYAEYYVQPPEEPWTDPPEAARPRLALSDRKQPHMTRPPSGEA